MWCIEKLICNSSNILQMISSQNSFLWESENGHKKDYNAWVLCHHWLISLWSHLSERTTHAFINKVLSRFGTWVNNIFTNQCIKICGEFQKLCEKKKSFKSKQVSWVDGVDNEVGL
jgi:hypothetical protein